MRRGDAGSHRWLACPAAGAQEGAQRTLTPDPKPKPKPNPDPDPNPNPDPDPDPDPNPNPNPKPNQARKFTEADTLQFELFETYGVEVDDRARTWYLVA